MKWLKRIGIFLLVFLLIGIIGFWIIDEPVPEGEQGEAADSLARKMMQAVNLEAWEDTKAIRWDFGGRRKLLWDRERHFAQVTWDEYQVVVNLNNRQGIVQEKKYNSQEKDEELIQKAWEIWVNDAFWLNPIAKLFDPGTERRLVTLDNGEKALLITYSSGGATPGDSYLWLVDDNGLPRAWKLWVSIIPIGGFQFSWEDWQTLPTGALVATRHQSAIFTLKLTEIEAARSLEGLVQNEDPFQELALKTVEEKPEESAPEEAPTEPQEAPIDSTQQEPDSLERKEKEGDMMEI